jgi:hypothetical protein
MYNTLGLEYTTTPYRGLLAFEKFEVRKDLRIDMDGDEDILYKQKGEVN